MNILSATFLGWAVLLMSLRSGKSQQPTGECYFSAEAKRIGLDSFLEELFHKYYELMPEIIFLKPGVTSEEIVKHYRPYNHTPSAIKSFTDKVRTYYVRLEKIIGKADESRLKLRENKVMYIAQYILKHGDWNPYGRDYYSGDWMFGQSLICAEPICYVLGNLVDVISHFKPKDLNGLDRIEELFKMQNETIMQYMENLKLGVTSGMVRSVEACKAGIHTSNLPLHQLQLDVHDEKEFSKGPLGEIILEKSFTSNITSAMEDTWFKKRGESVRMSLKRFMVDYLGKPVTRLIRYLEGEHLQYCYDGASGMTKLPIPFVCKNGTCDTSRQTTGTLPNGDTINTKYSYKRMLSFFTTSRASPGQLKNTFYEKLEDLLKKVKKLAVQYTGIQDEQRAVKKFKSVLKSRDNFFNVHPFPADESGEDAFVKCSYAEGAQAHCPMRWKALQEWIKTTKQVAKLLKPKIKHLFYNSTSKKTVPSCAVVVEGAYNPDFSFDSYEPGPDCEYSAFHLLPFFMDNYGPKYTEYTTTAHAQLPGIHLQVQGVFENFQDTCKDVISWLSNVNFVLPFSEGWAMYAEYYLMAKDTDAYANTWDKNILLQKYGMLKNQILAALRGALDIEVNYFGMTRKEAADLYDRYAWERSDLVIKDITRFQSLPGYVTAYSFGQDTFIKLRKLAEKELGDDFSIKEFHYQVLRQGEIPLPYLEKHVKRFITCKKDSYGPGCQEILAN